eukprot:2791065-Prymnesium_polylepis.1
MEPFGAHLVLTSDGSVAHHTPSPNHTITIHKVTKIKVVIVHTDFVGDPGGVGGGVVVWCRAPAIQHIQCISIQQ